MWQQLWCKGVVLCLQIALASGQVSRALQRGQRQTEERETPEALWWQRAQQSLTLAVGLWTPGQMALRDTPGKQTAPGLHTDSALFWRFGKIEIVFQGLRSTRLPGQRLSNCKLGTSESETGHPLLRKNLVKKTQVKCSWQNSWQIVPDSWQLLCHIILQPGSCEEGD